MAWRFFLWIIRFEKNVVRKQRESNFKPQEIIMKLSFKEGDWVDFNTWTSEFGVSGQSGINVSKANRLIVCITDNPPYEDDWYSNNDWDGVRFIGQGLKDHQTMDKANKALKETFNTNTPIHVFRKILNEDSKSCYLYCGIFILKTLPRQATQKDINGKKRDVFVFNLAAKNVRLNDDVKNAMIKAKLKIRLINN